MGDIHSLNVRGENSEREPGEKMAAISTTQGMGLCWTLDLPELLSVLLWFHNCEE